MEGISSAGMNGSSRVPDAAAQPATSVTNTTTNAIRSSGTTQVQSAVTSMLQNVGGGLENNDMLKALIALILIAALLQESLKGGGGSGDSLGALGNGRGDPTQFMSTSSSFSSFESTTTAYESTSVTATDAGVAGGTELGGRMDVTG